MAAKYKNGSVSLYIDFSGLLLNICLFLILYLEEVFNVKTSKFYDELKQNYPTLRVRQMYLYFCIILKHLSCNLFIFLLSLPLCTIHTTGNS